ncbi:uncharacterized protein LOC130694805 isoform X2 [Daphnia carinata]|uniref:uncharacterized protein LOC130694805 isoform X2 n=1 Tax=Daphnia carinata TaxID=120202 RepID=UPI00257DD6F0|nr:uncharacterized protein LOC130694805 isoform X2 [Daphnia carinata]
MAGQKKNTQLLSSTCGLFGWLPHTSGVSAPPVSFNSTTGVTDLRCHSVTQDVEEESQAANKDGAKIDEENDVCCKLTSTSVQSKAVGGRAIRLTWQEPDNCHESDGPSLVTSCIPAPVETSVALPQCRVRRASFEDPRPLPAKTNFELRRCKSEVGQHPSVTNADSANSPGIAQNALTSKDKIQAFARTARELRTLKLHYYPESGWGWVILFCASLTQCVSYGLLLAAGTLMTATTRRYGWTSHTANQQPPRFLVKPLPYVTTSALEPAILAHYRPVYLSSAVNYPAPIASPVAGALAALSLCVASLLSPVIVAWCRRKSTRLTAVFGGLLAALGLLFTSFASQFHQLFLSYGLVLGIGVGLTRDTATLMVGQYFKRRREAVEIALVGSSGIGLALMTVFLHTTLGAIGWRLGLQAVTGLVLLTFILGSCYRSASLYHPQRRAILHLKNQRKKIKEKNKHEEKPPFFDFTSLKSRTIQTIMVSTASIAAGIYTPLIYLGYETEKTQGRDSSMLLQVYMGLAWTLGCIAVGLLIVREPAECKIGRQYLCQAAGFLAALALLSQAVVSTPWYSRPSTAQQPTTGGHHGLFCWVYGFGLGAYHYALKMFVYQRVRARNFARAWSFVQASQALPLVCGIPLAGFLSTEYGQEAAYYASSAFVLSGSLALFVIDLRKYVLSKSHSHKHQHRKKVRTPVGGNRPRTPKVASEPNTDGTGGGASGIVGDICRVDIDGIEVQPEEDEDDEPCPPSCKSRIRRDSLADEEIHLPPLTLLQQTSLVLAQLGELPYGAGAAELTCISEEGIADMDIPDHLLEELDFAADCITSCDKVENYLMLSEYENNLIQQSSSSTTERKPRKSSFFRQIGQTFNGRYGNKSGFCESSCHHTANATNHAEHGNLRSSSNHRDERDHTDSPLKMIQIHESNEAEGRV